MIRSVGALGRRAVHGAGLRLASSGPAKPAAALAASGTKPPATVTKGDDSSSAFRAIAAVVLAAGAGGAYYYYQSLEEEKKAAIYGAVSSVRLPLTPPPAAPAVSKPPTPTPVTTAAAPVVAPAPPAAPAPVPEPEKEVSQPLVAPLPVPAPRVEDDPAVLHQAALLATALSAADTAAPAPATAPSLEPVAAAAEQPQAVAEAPPATDAAAAVAAPAEGSEPPAPAPGPSALSGPALAASTAWTLAKLSDVLRQDAATDGLAEVAGLSTQELRERVLRLNIELQQRAKWEAVRLAEVIAQNEAQWVAQFDDFAAKAQEKAQRDAAAGLADARAKMEAELLAHLAQERSRIEEELTAEANAQLRAAQQELMARVGTDAARRLAALDSLRAETGATEAALQAREEYERRARRVHKVVLATLALLQRSATGGPWTQEVAALQVAGGDDDVIAFAVRLFPHAAHAASGVPTVQELQARFAAVSKAARRAAVTPSNAGVLGDAVGAATAALLVSPTAAAPPVPAPSSSSSSSGSSSGGVLASALGLLPEWVRKQIALPGAAAAAGEAPTPAAPAEPSAAATVIDQAISSAKAAAARAEEVSAELQRAGAVLDAAQARVDAGDLAGALDALRPGLEGSAAAAAAEWCGAAENRVAADQAVSVARARAAVLAASVW